MLFALLGAGGAALAGTAFADDGSLQAAPAAPAASETWQHDSAGWHYLGSDGNPVKGDWVVTSTGPAIGGLPMGEHRYWIDANGLLAQNRVIDPSKARDAGAFAAGTCAYATKFGFPATGKKIVGNHVYLAKADGTLETGNSHGILTTSSYDGKKRVYYIDPKAHSAVVTKKPVKVSGYGWVFAQSKKGYLMTGRTVIGKKVYLARDNGKLETGNKKGFLSTKRYDGKQARLYYISPKTHAVTYGKPVKVSDKFGYVYAPNNKGYLLRACTKVDSKHILLIQKNGRIENHTGWLETSKYAGSTQRYRIERTKKNDKLRGACIGMFEVSGRSYYAESDGTIVQNTWRQFTPGGKIYKAVRGGALTVDTIATRMYQLAQGYSSPSSYLLMVDTDDPRVVVFEGSRGNWNVKYIWNCCTGAIECPTVVGTFSIGGKGYSFGEGNGYSCYYYSQISGDYLFHSQLYYPYTRVIQDGSMSKRCSHGCVRLYIDNARWIYENVPSGTTVACIR